MLRNISFILIISLAALIPFLYSGELYNGSITLKQVFFWISCGLLFLNLSFKVLVKNPFKIQLNRIDAALLSFSAYYLVRTFTTRNVPIEFNMKSQNFILLVCLYFMVKEYLLYLPMQGWQYFYLKLFLQLTALVQAIWGLLQLYGFIPSFHSDFPITGTFFNPAPFALFLTSIYPFALWEILNARNIMESTKKDLILRCVAISTLISILLVLPPTMNRASWFGVGLSSIFIFNQHYGWLHCGKAIIKNSIRNMLFFSILIIISGTLIIGLFRLKLGSSIGRLLVWEVTSDKILQKPFFGQGVGRFEAEYNNWQADYFQAHPKSIEGPKGLAAGNTEYCFNEYLEMASESGIVGLILFLNIFLIVFLSFRKNTEPFISSFFNSLIIRSPFSPFHYSILTLLICALVSFPFYSLPTLVLLFLNLAAISAVTKENLINFKMSFSRRINLPFKVITSLFFIFISTGIFKMSKKYYVNNSILNKGVKLYRTGQYGEACQFFQKAGPELQYNGVYLQFFGKALSMNGDYQKSLLIFEKARRYTSDEVLYTNLGLTCDSLKRYPEAEWSYLHAAAMAPHKLYPLYLLANHYKAAGQYEQAITTAEKIINKKIKVQSMATDQIIGEMKILLEGKQNKKEK